MMDDQTKSLLALLDEIRELGGRFKRLVDRISSLEESASNLELELSGSQERLEKLVEEVPSLAEADTGIPRADKERRTPDGPSKVQRYSTTGRGDRTTRIHSGLSDLLDEFRRLDKRFKRHTAAISVIDSSSANISFALSGIVKRLAGILQPDTQPSSGNIALPLGRRDDKIPPHLVEPLKWLAEPGVTSLRIKRRADGWSETTIDSGKKIVLPPMLTDLLIVLSEDSGRRVDDLVGWKTPGEVARSLSKRVGYPVSLGALRQNIMRLKRKLYPSVNPFLVQTHEQFGYYRFALRREQKAVSEGDPR